MKIAIACDHAGYPLKLNIIEFVRKLGLEVMDLGADSETPSDYPDFAVKIGHALQKKEVERGILICGSGVGACIAANKIKGVFACVCHDTYSAHQGVEHDDMNVLCLGARVIGTDLAKEIVSAFLAARYIGNDPGQERHNRRVSKIRELEKSN
jgi:ribose 5-phosphate isomerase B